MLKHFYFKKNKKCKEDKDCKKDNDLLIKLSSDETIDKISINVKEYKVLLESKGKIDTHIKIWDKNKKKKNKYELVYVSNRNKYFNVANYIPISRSYFKLWEILYDIKYTASSNKTCHIAEGPGGFIEATINYCRLNRINIEGIDAITLKEDSKDVPNWNMGQRMIKENNIRIHYGKDGTGNIYNIQNVLDFIIKVGKNSADIITADGGFDYSIDYNKQEQLSYRLFLCELVIAVSLQKPGGMYIFKIFDISTKFTIQLLYILYKSYGSLSIMKPYTSRMANSEKYVICRGFIGISNENINNLYNIINQWEDLYPMSIVDMDNIESEFIEKIEKYNESYITYQIDNINRTLLPTTQDDYKLQVESAYNWCERYKMPINMENKYTNLFK
jgi:23S rRNA U2552 (ribose-2'-O)-methylase RlmE/FtsJ